MNYFVLSGELSKDSPWAITPSCGRSQPPQLSPGAVCRQPLPHHLRGLQQDVCYPPRATTTLAGERSQEQTPADRWHYRRNWATALYNSRERRYGRAEHLSWTGEWTATGNERGDHPKERRFKEHHDRTDPSQARHGDFARVAPRDAAEAPGGRSATPAQDPQVADGHPTSATRAKITKIPPRDRVALSHDTPSTSRRYSEWTNTVEWCASVSVPRSDGLLWCKTY